MFGVLARAEVQLVAKTKWKVAFEPEADIRTRRAHCIYSAFGRGTVGGKNER